MRIKCVIAGACALLAMPCAFFAADIHLQGREAAAALEPSGAYESLGKALRDSRHGIHARFDASSVTAENPDGRMQLRLTALGYGDHPQAPDKAVLRAEGNRIEYRRGSLTEWYVNDSRGIEQGFTLRQPPANNDGGPLTIELAVTGDMTPVLKGDHIELRHNGHTALVYTGLRAWDAEHRPLAARMLVRWGRIHLRISDHGAAYPITIDPWIQQQELVANNGAANDAFGISIAVSGNTAVVGANGKFSNQGAAYVFQRTAGTWSFSQELQASDGAAGDSYGTSVAISGNTILVGAPMKNNLQGAVYVYTLNGSSFSQQQILHGSDGQSGDQFGTAVAISGGIAVIGAPDRGTANGVAYIFVQSGSNWVQQQELGPSDNGFYDVFGDVVAIDGTTAVVSASGTRNNLGTAYVFVQSGSVWNLQQQLSASDGQQHDVFGYGAAISGNTIALGADRNGVGGAVYVYTRSGITWTPQQKLTASDAQPNDGLGFGLALNGDTLIAGADGVYSDVGKAYVFQRSGGVWTQQPQEIVPSDGQTSDAFGTTVAFDGTTLLISASNQTTSAGASAGLVYVYNGGNGPNATNVTSTTANGTYSAGQTVDVTVTFSGTVMVTGTPQIALNSGGVANYVAGSGTPVLSFNYIVGAGQASSHLDESSSAALTLNGGTINASDGTTPASLTLPATGAAGSLGANANIVIARATSTSLNSSVNPSVAGQSIILTANVSPSSATGSVTFKDGASTLNTVALTSGTANLMVSTLTAGQHSLTAVYSGDSIDMASTSPIYIQNVNSGGFSINGTLTFMGNPINGADVVLSGSQSGSTFTGAAGTYSYTGLAGGGTFTVTPWAEGYTFVPPSITFTNLSTNQTANFTAMLVGGLDFYPVTPCRVADTRTGAGFSGQFGPPTMSGGSTRTFSVPASPCAASIPANVAAYSLNFTVVPGGGPSANLTTWPHGLASMPSVSTLNYGNSVVANAAIVPAGITGSIDVFVNYSADVVFDIDGYFAPPTAPGLEFFTLPPCRIADTRATAGFSGQFGPPTMSSGMTRTFNLPQSSCGIPTGAAAYSLNFTVSPPISDPPANLTTWPATQPSMPNVSTLNYSNFVVANAAIVPAGTNNAIDVFVNYTTDVIFDTNGYFAASLAGLRFYPVTPCRIADTRSGAGFSGQFGPPTMPGGTTRTFAIPQASCGIPGGASAYSLNFTAIPPPGGPGANLTTWPAGGASMPNVSTLNYYGSVVANAAIVPAGTNGAINVFVNDMTDVLFDINGYFAQ